MLQLRRNVPTDLLFLFGMMVVTLAGVITPAEAFAGLASTAVLTIGSLLVVAAGLRHSQPRAARAELGLCRLGRSGGRPGRLANDPWFQRPGFQAHP